MVKQTYSVMIDVDGSQKKWHLTAYFTHRTVDGLGTIESVPEARDLQVPPGLCVSTRTSNKRQKAQRRAAGPSSPSSHLRSPTSSSTHAGPRPSRKFAPFSNSAGDTDLASASGTAGRNPYPAALGTPPPDAPVLLTTTAHGNANTHTHARAVYPPAPPSPAPSSSGSHASSWPESPTQSSHSGSRRRRSRTRSSHQPMEDVQPSLPFTDHTNAHPRTFAFAPKPTTSTMTMGGQQHRTRAPSPTRSLAPLRTLERAHPYRRDPADERALRLLVFGGAGGPGGLENAPRSASAGSYDAEMQCAPAPMVMCVQGDRRLGIESY
jgi:hypothetical protein